MAEIEYSFKECYELQMIDCNCNNCIHMIRDNETRRRWEDWHRKQDEEDFIRRKEKAISDAQFVIDRGTKNEDILDVKSGQGMMYIAKKMKWQFDKKGLINYGFCEKFQKQVTFIPQVCQIETQNCFKHRKTPTND